MFAPVHVACPSLVFFFSSSILRARLFFVYSQHRANTAAMPARPLPCQSSTFARQQVQQARVRHTQAKIAANQAYDNAIKGAVDAAAYKFNWADPRLNLYCDHSMGADGSSGVAVAFITPEGDEVVVAYSLSPVLDNNLGEGIAMAVAGSIAKDQMAKLKGLVRGSHGLAPKAPQANRRDVKVAIIPDSQTMVEAINGYRTVGGEYEELVERTLRVASDEAAEVKKIGGLEADVRFRWVLGHTDHEALRLHTLADYMANKARLAGECFVLVNGARHDIDRAGCIFTIKLQASFVAHKNARITTAPRKGPAPVTAAPIMTPAPPPALDNPWPALPSKIPAAAEPFQAPHPGPAFSVPRELGPPRANADVLAGRRIATAHPRLKAVQTVATRPGPAPRAAPPPIIPFIKKEDITPIEPPTSTVPAGRLPPLGSYATRPSVPDIARAASSHEEHSKQTNAVASGLEAGAAVEGSKNIVASEGIVKKADYNDANTIGNVDQPVNHVGAADTRNAAPTAEPVPRQNGSGLSFGVMMEQVAAASLARDLTLIAILARIQHINGGGDVSLENISNTPKNVNTTMRQLTYGGTQSTRAHNLHVATQTGPVESNDDGTQTAAFPAVDRATQTAPVAISHRATQTAPVGAMSGAGTTHANAELNNNENVSAWETSSITAIHVTIDDDGGTVVSREPVDGGTYTAATGSSARDDVGAGENFGAAATCASTTGDDAGAAFAGQKSGAVPSKFSGATGDNAGDGLVSETPRVTTTHVIAEDFPQPVLAGETLAGDEIIPPQAGCSRTAGMSLVADAHHLQGEEDESAVQAMVDAQLALEMQTWIAQRADIKTSRFERRVEVQS
ncbi:hypothetical protein B0T22DRAFT_441761 [Podospora appendiculata]|uniref:RNase H type-1 domain-containing protein n=1 Tax=Podospora appendiculata TaxID=314037 RepID=A0AAE1CE90_9PEZI|nr:hypothetical protein B0T22DRAFT_441761 [Podospora appendiculata]